jgi:splicing factor U2AF subunit
LQAQRLTTAARKTQADTSSGTEQDRVNCSFYLKIGACRHGDRCSRKHIKPQFSQTILLPNVYNNPAHTPEGAKMGQAELQRNFDAFYEDFWVELCKYGNLVELHVSGAFVRDL